MPTTRGKLSRQLGQLSRNRLLLLIAGLAFLVAIGVLTN